MKFILNWRQRRVFCLLTVAILFATTACGVLAQSSEPKTPDDREVLQKSFDGVSASYRAKDYSGALKQLKKLEAMPVFAKLPADAKPGVIYTEACLYALVGDKTQAMKALRAADALGYSDYAIVSTDQDLISLRDDPEFKQWFAAYKAKNGPQVYSWASEKNEPAYVLNMDQTDDPKLKQLRAEFPADAALAGATDDYERLQRLAAWTSRQWEHSNSESASSDDPLTILREAKAGGKFICMNYAVALGGEASAYGLPARLLGLLPKGTETRMDAHSVVEVWLPDRRKWVLADGQYGQTATVDGVPLNAVELEDALAKERKIQCSQAATCTEWLGFIQKYLYYFKISREQRWFESFKADQLVLMPKDAATPKSMNGNTGVFVGARFTSTPAVFYEPLH